MLSLTLCLHLVLAPAAPGLGFLDGYERRDVPTGVLYSTGWSESEVRWAETYLPDVLARVEKRLGRRLGKPFATLLVGNYAELRRVVESLGGSVPDSFTRGVAFPSRRLIVVRGDLVWATASEDPTSVTIAHEVAHLVLHRRPETRLPRWLDEGIAVWVAGGRLPPRDEAEISLFARTNSLYRFRSLEDAFPEGHFPTTIAYKQSFLFVLFIVERHGDEAVSRLLDQLEAGTPHDRALRDLTGLEFDALEKEFYLWVAARWSLVVALFAYFNIWAVIGLLAVVAILRNIVRRRRGMRRLEEEEQRELEDRPEPEVGQ